MPMRVLPGRVALMLAVCTLGGRAHGQRPALPDEFGGYSTRRIIVQFTPQTEAAMAAARSAAKADPNADAKSFLSPRAKSLFNGWRASRVRPLYVRPFRNPELAGRLGLDRVYVVDVPTGSDTIQQARFASSLRDEIEIAFEDGIGGVALTPDDPSFDQQYALNNTGQISGGVIDADIDAVEAWSIHTGDPGTVTIAIIDSGVDPHPEYSARMVPGRNTNDPGNPTLTTDGCPHGTHVAGIAAASGNNGLGIAGVSWEAMIMPVRVLNGCTGAVSDLSSGIVWASDNGADILNISLQYYNLTVPQVTNLQNAINYARGLGIVVVGAAGNNNAGGVGVVAYPARASNVIGVSATDHADVFAVFSNYGPQVDVSAPGKDILSTWTGNGYNLQFGTSMATPHVSGTAALLMSYQPELLVSEIEDVIQYSADDRGTPGWDNRYGWGRLNTFAALQSVDCVARLAALEPVQIEAEYVQKSRTLSIIPSNAGRSTAIRVTLTSLHHPNPPYSGGEAASFAAFEGKVRWVGPPMEFVESQSSQIVFRAAALQCTPHYMDWSTVGLLHVYGAEVLPSSSYKVDTILESCSLFAPSFVSASVTVGTARWGDVEAPFSPPEVSIQPDFADISAMVNKFKSLPAAPIKARAVLAANVPDMTPDVGFDQISACVDAFRGLPYPFPGPVGCP